MTLRTIVSEIDKRIEILEQQNDKMRKKDISNKDNYYEVTERIKANDKEIKTLTKMLDAWIYG